MSTSGDVFNVASDSTISNEDKLAKRQAGNEINVHEAFRFQVKSKQTQKYSRISTNKFIFLNIRPNRIQHPPFGTTQLQHRSMKISLVMLFGCSRNLFF